MPISFHCAACFREFSAPRAAVGKRVRCRACGHIQRIAHPDTPPSDPSVYGLAPELTVASTPVQRPSTPMSASKPAPGRRTARSRSSIFQESQVQGLACGLMALSAADVFMTFSLLRTSPAFFESNPIAQWFFARWNIAGMVAFKFSMIAAVIVMSEFIERRRPGWGRFVLLIGCAGAAYAVCKGLSLYMGHPVPPPVLAADNA